MEKSSEKIIGSNKLNPNPFNNLMSEVQIRINQPKSTKKIENYALQIDSHVDKSNSNLIPLSHYKSKNENHLEQQNKQTHHHVFVLNAPLKTKNSSDTHQEEKSQKNIIDEWIIGFMGKRHILGIHWEENLAEKQRLLMTTAFEKLKENTFQKSSVVEGSIKKYGNIYEVCNYLVNNRMKQFFNILKQYYKDDLLFGLSNTMGGQKDHSLMLKIESDYQSLSVQSKKFKKEGHNNKIHDYSFSDHSRSNKNLNKKQSQSGSASEDLSNLILNHNKLKLEDDLNKSVPNIPKNKSSQKSIKTNKQIAELSIQTKKFINTQKKLGDDKKIENLPIQSNKNLANTKKEISNEDQPHLKQEEDKKPVTFTFILNQLNTGRFNKDQTNSQLHSQLIKVENNKNIQNVNLDKKQFISDQNIINRLPFAESFYQNARDRARPIQFVQKIDQKRSTSLQIKPGYVPLFPEAMNYPGNNYSIKRIFANQYYPEQCNRENFRFAKEEILIPNEKVRPKSATPKITFTFTSNTNRVDLQPNTVRVVCQNIHHLPQYDNQDFIVQSVLNPHNSHNQVVKPALAPQKSKNKLQIVTSLRNSESPKRHVPPNKIALDHRQHIKNSILPPAFNDYGVQNEQRQLKAQKSNGKIFLAENQIVYSDKIHKSTAQNSHFGCSPRQSNLHYQTNQPIRMRSPKDKIFVTYANPCNL